MFLYIHSLVGARAYLPRPLEGVPSQCAELLRHTGGRGLRPKPPVPPCPRCTRGTGELLRAGGRRLKSVRVYAVYAENVSGYISR